MQRCWETVPDKRPSFSEITVELETLLQESQITGTDYFLTQHSNWRVLMICSSVVPPST
ncbi:hypothetical protein H0E87_004229 [Populus deltoides]|nr:hypothetical protein H0E87_004229 [Populus deltoides]